MRHIVYCWEMGEGLGHLVAMANITARLVAQGHRVTCMVKDLAPAPRWLNIPGVSWMAAPRLWSANRVEIPLNHADILHNVGYSSADNVHALLVAWRTALALLRPDRVICDYAPTARLAAATLGIEAVCIDNGFSMPPLGAEPDAPLPLVRVTLKPTRDALAASEQRTLGCINGALERLGAAPLPAFSSLFRAPVWYRNWSELNHFASHAPERHLGPIVGESDGAEPVWPKGKGPTLFAYLKPRHPDSLPILKAALARGYRVLAYLPGFPQEALRELSRSGRLVASAQPFDLSRLPDDVDIGIWHSPTGAVARSLNCGMRMIFLPMHPEQYLACMAVRRAGVPAHVSHQSEPWARVFERVEGWPRATPHEGWRPADVSEFAERLAWA